MAPLISPAIVVGIGPIAENILNRAQELIMLRNNFISLPPIFQFIKVDDSSGLKDIERAHITVTNKRSIVKTEELYGLKVMPSPVESYLISPLHSDHEQLTIETARTLKQALRKTISGNRNAVFLIPRIAPELASQRRSSAEKIDLEIKENLLFNRGFFIDEVDEFGETVEEADLIELVARFISLAVASEVSSSIRTQPVPYVGEGNHSSAYASFSCSNITLDRSRMIDSLSTYLLEDIRQRLFATSALDRETDTWVEQAERWFANSLEGTLSEPKVLEVSDLKLDKDFNLLKSKLDEFTLSACRALFQNINTYGRVLDSLLKRAVAQLESHAEKIKETKKQISELQIKILVGPEIKQLEPEPPKPPEIKRNWLLICILGVLGLGGLIALIVVTNGRLQDQIILTALASGLLIAALILLRGNPEDPPPIEPPKPVASYAEQLAALTRKVKEQKKRENIHLALFIYLDFARSNLEDLRCIDLKSNREAERSIFDLDFTNEQLARSYYLQHYETKEADIAEVIKGGNLDQIHQVLFSNFNVKLIDHLKEYCKRCFEKANGYDLDKALHLSKSLNGHRPALAVSSPLWHPQHPDSDKVVLAITSNNSNDMRTLLRNTFGDYRVQFFDTQNHSTTTLVQIAYGQELRNILNDPS